LQLNVSRSADNGAIEAKPMPEQFFRASSWARRACGNAVDMLLLEQRNGRVERVAQQAPDVRPAW